MEKKIWSAPRVELVQFGANEYVATCYRSASFECNANGNIFWDNGNGTAQILDAANGGHLVFEQTYPDVDTLAPNGNFANFNYTAFYENANNGTYNADQLMGTLPFGTFFDPDACDHSGTVYENQVSYGYAVGYYGTEQDYVFSTQTHKVIIFHQLQNGILTGLHAMLNDWTFSNGKYDSSIWSAKNAS